MSTAWSFACSCALLVAVPGPATLLVGKNAALRGLRSAMTTARGVFTADLVWMTASVIGLTAVLVAFEPAFLAVGLIGSAYLIVLGLRLQFSRDHGPSEDRSLPQRRLVKTSSVLGLDRFKCPETQPREQALDRLVRRVSRSALRPPPCPDRCRSRGLKRRRDPAGQRLALRGAPGGVGCGYLSRLLGARKQTKRSRCRAARVD